MRIGANDALGEGVGVGVVEGDGVADAEGDALAVGVGVADSAGVGASVATGVTSGDGDSAGPSSALERANATLDVAKMIATATRRTARVPVTRVPPAPRTLPGMRWGRC